MSRAAGRRPIVTAVAAATVLSLLGDYLLYTVLPSRPEVAGIGVAALGIVLSVHRFVRLAANPVSGLLYDRLGRRRPFLLGMALGGMLTISWGVALAHRMPERRLRALFAVCLIATAIVMLVRG